MVERGIFVALVYYSLCWTCKPPRSNVLGLFIYTLGMFFFFMTKKKNSSCECSGVDMVSYPYNVFLKFPEKPFVLINKHS